MVDEGAKGERELRVALDGFGLHDGLEANKATALEVVGRLCAGRGTTISEVRWTRGEGRPIRVFFSDDPSAVAATIEYGFVRHRDPLPGAIRSRQKAAPWYTEFPINQIRGRALPTSEPKQVMCPNCYVLVPVGAACGTCDWTAEDAD